EAALATGESLVIRTTRASWMLVGDRGVAASSRRSFDAHHRSVLAAYPSRRLNTSARSPLARHRSTRSNQTSAVLVLDSMPSTMRYAAISSLHGARAPGTCRRYFFEAAICRYPVGLLRVRAIYAADHAVRRAPVGERRASASSTFAR
ncbi:MAG: hypothetical protein KIT31_42375, partial [Deltaproteobacteria bacterium]|nr:hypothetical protein [Deltaproteobacteria bacterium]